MMASRALGQCMADQLQQVMGTPGAALTNDINLNSTIVQNELALMAAAGRKKP